MSKVIKIKIPKAIVEDMKLFHSVEEHKTIKTIREAIQSEYPEDTKVIIELGEWKDKEWTLFEEIED